MLPGLVYCAGVGAMIYYTACQPYSRCPKVASFHLCGLRYTAFAHKFAQKYEEQIAKLSPNQKQLDW